MTLETDYERGGTQKASYSPEEVVEVPCPFCGDSAGPMLAVEHGSIGIKQCAACSLIYTSPRIREPERIYWGDFGSYVSEARLIFSGQRPHHRDPNYLEELSLVERYKPSQGRLLDVGCNMGMLLRLANARGWEGIGVEPSPPMHRIATEMFGLEVFKGFLDDVPAEVHGSFDVVALSDVFEHVTQPRQLLRSAAACLKPDGLLYVKVPNARWNLLKQQMAKRVRRAPRSLWDSYEHVVHYTDETLERMLRAESYEPLILTFSRPVQVPVWHEYVGQYFQYPSPWVLDWRRHLGRTAFHAAAVVERAFRDRIGYCAQNLVAIARRQPNAPHEGPSAAHPHRSE